jgi:hypothetical protein
MPTQKKTEESSRALPGAAAAKDHPNELSSSKAKKLHRSSTRRNKNHHSHHDSAHKQPKPKKMTKFQKIMLKKMNKLMTPEQKLE